MTFIRYMALRRSATRLSLARWHYAACDTGDGLAHTITTMAGPHYYLIGRLRSAGLVISIVAPDAVGRRRHLPASLWN
jgi:hypothetical protein